LKRSPAGVSAVSAPPPTPQKNRRLSGGGGYRGCSPYAPGVDLVDISLAICSIPKSGSEKISLGFFHRGISFVWAKVIRQYEIIDP